MRKKPNSKLIGLFILCGIGLFVATIGMFVSDKLAAGKNGRVVMYFSESIKGLDVGSPVMFKGVTIGRVSKIDLITDMKDVKFSIPVYATFSRQNFNPKVPHEERSEVLEELVKHGLRARLNTQNYLTGQLMIELEMMDPNAPLNYRQKDGQIPEIPTVLSPLAEISQGIQEIPLKETVKKINKFVDLLNDDLVPQFTKVLNDMSKIPQQTAGVPEGVRNFSRAMQNVSAAAKALSNFADYVERHPESLLKGKK